MLHIQTIKHTHASQRTGHNDSWNMGCWQVGAAGPPWRVQRMCTHACTRRTNQPQSMLHACERSLTMEQMAMPLAIASVPMPMKPSVASRSCSGWVQGDGGCSRNFEHFGVPQAVISSAGPSGTLHRGEQRPHPGVAPQHDWCHRKQEACRGSNSGARGTGHSESAGGTTVAARSRCS